MFHLTTLTPRKYEQIRNLLFLGIFWWIYNFSRKVRRNKYETLHACTNTNTEILWGITKYTHICDLEIEILKLFTEFIHLKLKLNICPQTIVIS